MANTKLLQGDCLELMKTIPNKSIDLILCDLPYGVTQNRWDSCIPLDKLWNQYIRIIKQNGAILLTAWGLFTAQLILSQPKMYKYNWVWVKSKATNFLNAKKQPLRKHEDICVFYQNPPIYNPQMEKGESYDKGIRKNQHSGSYGNFQPTHISSNGERYPTDILYFKTAESEGDVLHPTQKPVALCEYLIRTYTNAGDLVLDNCMGSGSTGVAAINTNRNFIGIELEEKYFEVAKSRIDAAKHQMAWTPNKVSQHNPSNFILKKLVNEVEK